MEGFVKYVMQHYHSLGILLVVIIIAVKLFVTTRKAKEMLDNSKQRSKINDIIARLERIEQKLPDKQ